MLERHPVGSQAFFPLGSQPFLAVVANGEKQPDLTSILCFLTKPGQGVNYARGDWHHPLIALGDESDFLVIDRAGADTDDTFIALGHMTVAWVGYQGSRARATVHRV